MIAAVHTLIYADDAEAARAFFADVLEFPFVDTGGGWLIFKTGPSELGVHPTSGEGWSTPEHHEISFLCNDIETTVEELGARGAEFASDIEDKGFGLTIDVKVPGTAVTVMVYQPKYAPPAVTL
jgi:catechol 2,3-dioxygenase-like lactoylglutathione lyase family enzyme